MDHLDTASEKMKWLGYDMITHLYQLLWNRLTVSFSGQVIRFLYTPVKYAHCSTVLLALARAWVTAVEY